MENNEKQPTIQTLKIKKYFLEEEIAVITFPDQHKLYEKRLKLTLNVQMKKNSYYI